MKYPVLSAFLVLALISLACGFSVDLPARVTPGPDQTQVIDVSAPSTGTTRLELNFGAGEMTLAGGAGEKLVEGTVIYNVNMLKPEVVQSGATVTIKQESDFDFTDILNSGNLKNEWDLKLGEQPMELVINSGAYSGKMALGGLALERLTIQDGASSNDVTFDEPNPVEMSELRYDTGASNVTLTGLANANLRRLTFKAGAGDYNLDFSGDLQRDAAIDIDCGLSDLTLQIPAGVNAVVTVDGGLNNVNSGSGWTRSDDTYTQSGDGPTLTIRVNMGAGNLTLTQ